MRSLCRVSRFILIVGKRRLLQRNSYVHEILVNSIDSIGSVELIRMNHHCFTHQMQNTEHIIPSLYRLKPKCLSNFNISNISKVQVLIQIK